MKITSVKVAALAAVLLCANTGFVVAATQVVCSPAPLGVPLNDNGCPCDQDQDGVPNYLDRCPVTPDNFSVDSNGCRETLTKTESIRVNVNFENDKAIIHEVDVSEVKKIADFLNQYATVNVEVEGHTDSNASDSYNVDLSGRRAHAVKTILLERFSIPAERVSAVGYGERRPIATNETAEGQRTNRRIVAVIQAQTDSPAAPWGKEGELITDDVEFCKNRQ